MKNYTPSTSTGRVIISESQIVSLIRSRFRFKAHFWHGKLFASKNDLLRYKFQEAYKELDLNVWDEVLNSFICYAIKLGFSDGDYTSKAYIARLIEKAYNLHAINNMPIHSFRSTVLDIANRSPTVHDIFFSQKDLINLDRKRQPSLIESLNATIERLIFLESLPQIFNKNVRCMLVGGSTAYGPFLNVRSGDLSSDIDMIVVVDNVFFEENISAKKYKDGGIFTDEVNSFEQRKKIFSNLYREEKADVLSQRFKVRHHDFSVSIHFFPVAVFEKVFSTDLQDSLNSRKETIQTVKDYKDKRYEFTDCNRWSFGGDIYTYKLPAQVAVTAGFVTELPGYIVNDRRFYPGFYHHIVLPARRIIYDRNDYAVTLLSYFNALIAHQIDYERKADKDVSLLKSHPRYPIFAPGKYDNWPSRS